MSNENIAKLCIFGGAGLFVLVVWLFQVRPYIKRQVGHRARAAAAQPPIEEPKPVPATEAIVSPTAPAPAPDV